MTQIKLKQLNSESRILTKQESEIIIGSAGWLQTVQGITGIATGVATIGTGIQQVYAGYQVLNGNAPAAPSAPGGPPNATAGYIQYALQPSIHVG